MRPHCQTFAPRLCLCARHDQRICVEEGGTDPLFASSTGCLRDPKNANRDLRRAYNTAGRPEISSHVFRRSVATAMDAVGLTPRMAADQLGHERVSMPTTSTTAAAPATPAPPRSSKPSKTDHHDVRTCLMSGRSDDQC